ncbi:hypothetical protein GCK32_010390, partial [Trichostrongylus colubriformis]
MLFKPSMAESYDGLDVLVDHVEVVDSSTAECSISQHSHQTLVDPNRTNEEQPKLPNVYVKGDRTWKFQKTTVVATCGENGLRPPSRKLRPSFEFCSTVLATVNHY